MATKPRKTTAKTPTTMPTPSRPRKARGAKRAKAQAASHSFGARTLAAGAAALGIGGALVALFFRRARANPAEHAAPDLALDRPRPGAHDRAPAAFRPDPTAVPTKAERDALRPATGPTPSITQPRGTLNGQSAPENG